ncbi:MAG: hypothetical protein ACT4PO_08640 [Actinomycetota bacterium]
MAQEATRVLRGLAVALLSGIAAGLVVGLGARIAMRVVTLTEGRPTEFTAGGTLGILLGLTIFGLPFAGLFVLVRGHLPESTTRKGLLFGAGMMIFPGLLFFLPFGPGSELVSIGFPPLNYAMFAGLFLLFGLVLALAAGWLDGKLPRRTDRQPAVAAAQASESRSGPNADFGM